MQNKLSQNLTTQNNTHFLPYNHRDIILQGALPEGLLQDGNQGVRRESSSEGLTGEGFNSKLSGCWQNSVPHWLLVRGLPQFLAT